MVWTKLPARKKGPGKPGCMVAPHKEQLILGFATCYSTLRSPEADPQRGAEPPSPAAGLQSTHLGFYSRGLLPRHQTNGELWEVGRRVGNRQTLL